MLSGLSKYMLKGSRCGIFNLDFAYDIAVILRLIKVQYTKYYILDCHICFKN